MAACKGDPDEHVLTADMYDVDAQMQVHDMIQDSSDVPGDSSFDMPPDISEKDASPDLATEPPSTREQLPHARMRAGRTTHEGRYVSMRAFSPDVLAKVGAADALDVALTFEPVAHSIGVLRDDAGRAQVEGIERPPSLTIELSRRQEDGALVPGARGVQVGDAQDAWWAIVGVGTSWSEPDDQGWSRATLPLTLVEPHANCSFHGVMTWLYHAQDGTFSDAYYQISQETCLYFKANLWGWFEVSAQPLPTTRAEEILDEYGREDAAMIPAEPIENIKENFGVELSRFSREVNPQHITTQGVVWQGVHYRGSCSTRQDEHPLCEALVLPSYSTAKSAVAGMAYLALLREEPELGRLTMADGLYEELDDVPEHWRDVTLEELLDMRSGHYDSAQYMSDEDGARMLAFFLEPDDKLKFLAALDFPAQPGVAPWVYHTSDTFLAMRVMQRLHGDDLFEWLAARVFTPLGLSLVARSAHLRTTLAEEESQHYGGYGSFWLPGDVALLAQALHDHADGARSDLFDGAELGAVMQRGVVRSGAQAAPGLWYHRGFWGLEVDESMGFPCRRIIPFMSGFGGITVAMLPNGATYYVFRDDAEFEWLGAAVELAKLGDFCGE